MEATDRNEMSLKVIAELEPRIMHLSRNTFVKGLGLDKEDLAQEARLKIIQVVDKYLDKNFEDLKYICLKSIWNRFGILIRKSKSEKYDGKIIDLSEIVGVYGTSSNLEELYLTIALDQIRSMADGLEISIMDSFVIPSEELVKQARKAALEYSVDKEVIITRSVLSEYLGISKTKLSRKIMGIRSRLNESVKGLKIVTELY